MTSKIFLCFFAFLVFTNISHAQSEQNVLSKKFEMDVFKGNKEGKNTKSFLKKELTANLISSKKKPNYSSCPANKKIKIREKIYGRNLKMGIANIVTGNYLKSNHLGL